MKNNYYKSLVAAAIISSFTQTAFAETIGPLAATQDTWTLDTSTKVRGEETIFRIDGDSKRSFVQFTVAGIPDDHVVDTATLNLKVFANKINKVLAAMPNAFIKSAGDGDWLENMTRDGDDALLAVAAANPILDSKTDLAAKSLVSFDVKDGISGNGKITFLVNMVTTGTDKWLFTSKDGGDAPTLTITTKPGTGAPVPTGDKTAPVFAADIPTIEINATGEFTDISAAVAAKNIKATDETDIDPIAAIITSETNLKSGIQSVTLQATDAAGNPATKEVTVNITPLVVITQPETLSIPPGNTVSASVALSGPAVSYPATIDYTIAGDATNDISDTLTFTAEDYANAKNVDIIIKADAEGGQSAVLTLAATSNVQASEETVNVTAFDGNIEPSVSLTLTQADKTIAAISASNADVIPYIDATKGDVTVTVVVQDFNSEDTHSLDWTTSSEVLAATGASFVFSPAELSGDFTLSVKATESNTTDKFPSNTLTAQVRIIATALPELVAEADSDNDGTPDTEEGFKDSDGDGIVDYLDDNADTTQLPLADEQASLQTLAGLTLSLGSVSAAQGIAAKSAVITLADLAASVAADSADTTDAGFLPIEGVSLFNFTISGLATAGDAAPVVYPLAKDVVIGEETEYRKYTPVAGWATFVSDADNSIASAAKDETGNCPAPNDELYLDGLTAGNGCIQLTIKDGGIYDADGIENSSIEDPGVLAQSFELIQWDTATIALPATDVNENSNVTLTKDLTTLVGDADFSALTFAVEDDASWLSIDEGGLLSAELSSLATGEHTANVSFTSENGQTGTTTVSVSVAFNSAPKLAAVELATASRNKAYSASIAESITDAESDTYTVEKVSGPYWVKVSETGELSGTPHNVDIGDNNITVKLTDEKGATSDVSFNVPVSDSEVRASDGGSFSAGLMAMLALVSLRRRKAQK